MTERIDRLIRGAAIRSANRHTRRSFLGRVGTVSASIATVGLAVDVGGAVADEPLCAGQSITCLKLIGTNGCPDGSCWDGGWAVPYNHCDAISYCGTQHTCWFDCCKRKSVCSCTHPQGYPSCCNDCVWNNTFGGWCGGGSTTEWTPQCRWHMCCGSGSPYPCEGC